MSVGEWSQTVNIQRRKPWKEEVLHTLLTFVLRLEKHFAVSLSFSTGGKPCQFPRVWGIGLWHGPDCVNSTHSVRTPSTLYTFVQGFLGSPHTFSFYMLRTGHRHPGKQMTSETEPRQGTPHLVFWHMKKAGWQDILETNGTLFTFHRKRIQFLSLTAHFREASWYEGR